MLWARTSIHLEGPQLSGTANIDADEMTNSILLMLKTPPPFGGGEVCSGWLRDYVAEKKGFIVEEIRSLRRTRSSQGSFAFWKLWEFLSMWLRLLILLIRYRPKVVYKSTAHGFVPFLRDSIFFWTARLFGAKFAGELAGEKFRFLYGNRISRWYGKLVLTRFSGIRVLGKEIASELSMLGVRNTVIMDNGVDVPNGISYLVEPSDGVIRILFVGLHSKAKGFDVLLRACGHLKCNRVRFELHTIGEWHSEEFRQEMLQFIETAHLADVFIFHGLQHAEEKWSIYSQCQVLVLPSLTEGQPLVILEAFGCGIPVVATRVGGIPDIIEDGVNGLLIDPGIEEDLAQALERLAQDCELRQKMSVANRILYSSRFTVERYVENHAAWLENCANERGTHSAKSR